MSEIVDPDPLVSMQLSYLSRALVISILQQHLSNQTAALPWARGQRRRLLGRYYSCRFATQSKNYISSICNHGSSRDCPGIECQIEELSSWTGSRLWYLAYLYW